MLKLESVKQCINRRTLCRNSSRNRHEIYYAEYEWIMGLVKIHKAWQYIPERSKLSNSQILHSVIKNQISTSRVNIQWKYQNVHASITGLNQPQYLIQQRATLRKFLEGIESINLICSFLIYIPPIFICQRMTAKSFLF